MTLLGFREAEVKAGLQSRTTQGLIMTPPVGKQRVITSFLISLNNRLIPSITFNNKNLLNALLNTFLTLMRRSLLIRWGGTGLLADKYEKNDLILQCIYMFFIQTSSTVCPIKKLQSKTNKMNKQKYEHANKVGEE